MKAKNQLFFKWFLCLVFPLFLGGCKGDDDTVVIPEPPIEEQGSIQGRVSGLRSDGVNFDEEFGFNRFIQHSYFRELEPNMLVVDITRLGLASEIGAGIGLQVQNLGQENQVVELISFGFSFSKPLQDGNLLWVEAYAESPEDMTKREVINFKYDQGSNRLTFDFSVTLTSDLSGNPVSVTGSVDDYVYKQVVFEVEQE